MKLPDKYYDVLKWIAMFLLPALTLFYSKLASIWGLPFASEISDTLVALNAFLGMVLGISTIEYNKEQ